MIVDTTTDTPTMSFTTVPEANATVSVDYLGTLEDGKVFDTNIAAEAQKAGTFNEARTYEPLKFNVGQGQMIPGFEKAVIGMEKDETKTVTISADEAYGMPKDDLIYSTGVAIFADAPTKPVSGEIYNFGGAAGRIISLDDTNVTIDFNHELAGKDLTFKITVIDIAPAQADTTTIDNTTGLEG